jgi:hypothetical protein
MIRMSRLLLAVATGALLHCALLGDVARAEDAAPQSADGRFSFHQVEGGYLRLDGASGEVSTCSKRQAGWVCAVVPAERSAYEAEIARLARDNAALKMVVLEHGLPLPAGIGPDAPASAERPRRLDQIMSAIGDLWRRVVAMVESAQRGLTGKS